MKEESAFKKLKRNTLTSVLSQGTSVICGFILPRQILAFYGSEVNGLVSSITQFLQIIALLELGVGAVVQSALYVSLARQDTAQISRILSSAQRFFKRIGNILLIYAAGLAMVYPLVVRADFGWVYTAAMVLTLSISTFAQYYFGMVHSLLLNADQRGYVLYTAQIVTTILNTVICVVLIRMGVGIHAIKLTTSLIFMLRPLFLRYYVARHYCVDWKIPLDGEPIAQKWNGIAQHAAAVVLSITGNLVLSVFSTLANVSIYAVYSLVLLSVKNLFLSAAAGVQSRLGELWARQEQQELYAFFGNYEWILHTAAVFVFGCTGTLIVPFVMVYTRGITDVQYGQPLFAVCFTLANGIHCLRLPYNTMILAAGHYRQTQSSHILAAGMSLVISAAAVISFGLIGAALGNLAAMAFQTLWMAAYHAKHLVKWPFRNFLKQVLVDAATAAAGAAATVWIPMSAAGYVQWAGAAVLTALIWLTVIVLMNLLFYRQRLLKALSAVRFLRHKNTIPQ